MNRALYGTRWRVRVVATVIGLAVGVGSWVVLVETQRGAPFAGAAAPGLGLGVGALVSRWLHARRCSDPELMSQRWMRDQG